MNERITSFQNPRVKLVHKLREKKWRQREGRFVIDYERDLARALHLGYVLDYALYCPSLAPDGLPFDLPSAQVYEVPREVMEKASYRDNPAALVAVLHARAPQTVDDLRVALMSAASGPLLVLVDLRKPGNIGALLRTADAVGFGAVLLVDTALDLYNPNVIRASTGACFLGNIYSLNSGEALAVLREAGFQLVAAHPEGEVSLFSAVFQARSALVLGTEDQGLSEAWRRASDALVRIPMMGQLADSLNVSVSGAVFMYEVLRQRLATPDN